MGKHQAASAEQLSSTVRCRGCASFRYRVCLSLLTGRTVRVDAIRENDRLNPGLRDYEVSFLRLIEKITNGTVIEINETGTSFRLRPGVIVNGRKIIHECSGRENHSAGRSISWFLEPLLFLCILGKQPLHIVMRGVTNDVGDPPIDIFRQTTIPLLRKLGVGTSSPITGVNVEDNDNSSVFDENFELQLNKRDVGHFGEVELRMPVAKQLPVIQLLDEGLIKRVRGVAYSVNVSPQFSNRMVDGCRRVLNNLLPDVFIFTDHNSGPHRSSTNKKLTGYGISLNAETTSGCAVSSYCDYIAKSNRHQQPNSTLENNDINNALEKADFEPEKDPEEDDFTNDDGEISVDIVPEMIGERAAKRLLEEVKRGGAVDTTHQSLLILLAASGPSELHRFRLGPLTPNAIRTLREVRRFMGVTFLLQPESETNTIIASCIGRGISNMSKRSM